MSAEEQSEPEAEAAAEPPPERPKKRKKAKGRKAAASERGAASEDGAAAAKEAAPTAATLPGAGTSAGEKLREAHRAFEVGDSARVRARTRELETAADPAVREAAADLAARIAIDPVQIVVVLACAAVLAAIVYVWVL